MRAADPISRDRLPGLMARLGPASASTLAAELGVSVATLHRLLQENAANVLSAGQARRSRHAWRRRLRDGKSTLPMAAIDTQGRAHDAGTLALVQPAGCWLPLAGTPWPLLPPTAATRRDPLFDAMHDGWWPGLPYPLQDLRPQGYLGRQLARAGHAEWGVSPDPQRWSDDEVLQVLAQVGSDGPGHLIVGEAALQRWQTQRGADVEPLRPAALGPAYAALADQAVAAGVAGSSAAGEFPKFPALRDQAGAATPHVLVKFSGAGDSVAERRWADLLVCEHLALQALRRADMAAASSAIVQHAGRTFLEVERFDRHGAWGRSPLVSLATLDATFVGQGSGDWPQLVTKLAGLALVDAAVAPDILRLWWFGQLIANTDMHTGNLSFRPGAVDGPAAPLQLAPAYDMLPMAFAPLPGGEVPPREVTPPLPPPTQRAPWLQACTAAMAFWAAAAADSRISAAFRRLATANAQALDTLRDRI